MNIKQAKEQIKNAVIAYFSKDEYGNYYIPIEKQRPVFLMGAPGIGKTAILEQVARELNVGLVSYSMTHHTRQSALGLPFITKKIYDGKEYDVSEYTMSEIIASVYDMIEKTGYKEGILFLDEINCVSETLAPAMLQFLQYKVFGRHSVPAGWLVVTAGNPPEFNNSVREFDIVTWDRLKRVDVEPDYSVWKEYAINAGVHASITTYLDIKKDDFYKIETTVDGKKFVTARGWCDLSDMIKLYEKNGLTIDKVLVSQYIQDEKIAKDYSVYYDLYNKYKSDYQITEILEGKEITSIIDRAKKAKFDERTALIGLLLESVFEKSAEIYRCEEHLKELLSVIKELRTDFLIKFDILAVDKVINKLNRKIDIGKTSSTIDKNGVIVFNKTIKSLEEIKEKLMVDNISDGQSSIECIKNYYNEQVKLLSENANNVSSNFFHAFKFLETAFGEGQEILLFVTEMTINTYTTLFISHYGCQEYFRHNKELLLYERHQKIIREINFFDIDD